MKARISPTSPKNKKIDPNKDGDKELDNYYQNTLKSIEKPSKSKSRASVGFLLVVIIFGFLAGIIGQIVLLSYGSDIPYLEKLDIFSWTNQQSLFINGRNNNELNTDQLQKVIDDVNFSIVQIFKYKEPGDTLESLYIPAESLGYGFVLTNDGYIVTASDIAPANERLVVITNNKEVYLASEIISDVATDFVFLKTDAKDLQTFNISDRESLDMMTDILLVRQYGFDYTVLAQQIFIIDNNFRLISETSDFISSSEKYETNILLSDNISESFNNSIAFTYDKKAIGVVKQQAGDYVIIPFSYIKKSILNLLGNGEVERPYLGINYVNLATTVNISDDLSMGYKKGILIYSNDEVNNPSIIENSPAYKAGLQTNDIITSVDGQILNGNTFFGNIILGFEPQDIITLQIKRGEEDKEIKVTLEEKL